MSTEFADTLRSLMTAKRMSASDLARAVWGTTKDYRGYEVARGRDRIGHYLSGKSYPGKDNLAKIAKALKTSIETLEKAQPAPTVREAETEGNGDIRVEYFIDGPNTARVSFRKIIVSQKSAKAIIALIDKDPVHRKHVP